MSKDPKTVMNLLGACALGNSPFSGVHLTGPDAAWLLSHMKHQDDRIAALSKLVKPAPAPRTFAPGELARTATFWEPMLGLPPGAIPDGRVALCLEAAELSHRCG